MVSCFKQFLKRKYHIMEDSWRLLDDRANEIISWCRGSSADEVGQGIFKIYVKKKMLSVNMTRLFMFFKCFVYRGSSRRLSKDHALLEISLILSADNDEIRGASW